MRSVTSRRPGTPRWRSWSRPIPRPRSRTCCAGLAEDHGLHHRDDPRPHAAVHAPGVEHRPHREDLPLGPGRPGGRGGLVVAHPPYRWQVRYRRWIESSLSELSARIGRHHRRREHVPGQGPGRARADVPRRRRSSRTWSGIPYLVLDTSHAAVSQDRHPGRGRSVQGQAGPRPRLQQRRKGMGQPSPGIRRHPSHRTRSWNAWRPNGSPARLDRARPAPVVQGRGRARRDAGEEPRSSARRGSASGPDPWPCPCGGSRCSRSSGCSWC